MAKKAVFNPAWCNKQLNPQWATWLQHDDENVHYAKCLICKRTFSLSNMGRQAIMSHENGSKHKKNAGSFDAKQLSLVSLIRNGSPSTVSINAESPVAIDTSAAVGAVSNETFLSSKEKVQAKNLNRYLLNDQITRAEVLWCLRTVVTHSSYRSNVDLPELFQQMFPDSDIAKKFQLKKDKTSYTLCFGLAPFFKDELTSTLCSTESFVVCFDESLNKIVQKGQMDVHVKFWQSETKTVKTRYLTSVFLGHADAATLLNAFKEAIPKSQLTNILQVSMDGPNVNHKFHSLLQNELRQNSNSRIMVDIGSCGLHIVHGAFKTGHKSTSWELNKFLYALYNLFKDCPARRSDYIKITGSSNFPLKFCSVRWVESSKAAQRALDILPKIRRYVKQAQVDKIEPDTKTYATIKAMLKCNEIVEAKLGFYISVAFEFEGFLRKFQGNKPLTPFLYEEVHNILKNLMRRFVKDSVVSQAILS